MPGLSQGSLLQLGALGGAFERLAAREDAAMTALCQRYSQMGAGFARENAPWKDRTGMARKSLHGKVVKDNMIRARISHGVIYGIMLEKKHSGRFAVLPKVLRRYEVEFLEDVKRTAARAVIG